MLFLAFYYGFALIVAGSISFFAYRKLRRFGAVLSALIALLFMAVAVLLWPIPIHGGFTVLGEVMYNDWTRERELAKQAQLEVVAVRQQLAPRFAGTISYRKTRSLQNGWSEVAEPSGTSAWLNSQTGIIWSNWTALPPSQSRPTLAQAKAHCAKREPQGYWALATAAENALSWHAGGHELMPRSPTSWMSFTTRADFGLELPSYHLRSTSSNQQPRNAQEVFSVRCVARSDTAPEWGYTQDDVDLELWNAYQLQHLIN
ncbi:MAG: hypothetical protein ACR2PZ_06755 [Pseudomonadales bacterium]